MDHLVAVAQLLRHDAQGPRLIAWVVGSRDRPLMLLDRPELGRGLRADLLEQMVRGLRRKVPWRHRLGGARPVPHLDPVRSVLLDLGAETERLVLREIVLPLLAELGVVGEVVTLPVLDRVVEGLGKGRPLVVHGATSRFD